MIVDWKSILSVIAMMAVSAGTGQAGTVAEWQFNPDKDLPGGEMVKLDQSAPGASNESVLMKESKVVVGATGISDKWQPYLSKGYLEVLSGAGENSAEKHGLLTRSTAGDDADNNNAKCETYMGFSGLGSGAQGGTVYLVVSPQANSTGIRRGLMGSGLWVGQPLSTWSVTLLWTKDGALRLMAGRGEGGEGNAADLNGDGDQSDYLFAETAVTQTWDPKKWYFIAASWKEDAAPVLYVREMANDGPAASPAGVAGKVTEAKGNIVAKVPTGTAVPSNEPIAIGANWVNHGNAQTRDGADAKIAYVRIENTFTDSPEKMDAAFKGLAAP